MGKFKDLTGQRFGKLTVIERTTDYIYPSGTKGVRWKCQCDCGKIVEIMTQPLKDGQTKSCGCSKGEFISLAVSDNLIGKKFNHLTVIQRNGYIVHNDRTTLQWLCKCDCGNQVSATAYQLKNDIIKSCGCLTDNIHHKKCCDDITGQKFGKLTAIEKVENKWGKLHWRCLCDCGNEIVVASNSLVSHKTTSCGCILSYGEYQVSQYLLQHNVKFESQKKFDNLIGVGNGKLSYDFYLPQHNLLIECQGKQHQSPIELFGGTEQFKIQQEHDRRKKDYAKFHGYELLEVWYYDYNNIENILNDKIKNIS